MSREAALRFLDAFNRHDLATIEEMLARDVRAVSPRGTVVGRDELMNVLRAAPAPGTGMQELRVELGDRTLDEDGDTVTTTVRRNYYWSQTGDYSHAMLARTSLTLRDGKIAAIEEFPAERVEG